MYARTLSLRKGAVSTINAIFDVQLQNGWKVRMVNQVVIGPCTGGGGCSSGGDSGGLWVSDDAIKNPLALHSGKIGSYAIAGRLVSVLSYFGVTIDGNPAPTAIASGAGLVANCGLTCGDPEITSVSASGNTLTIRDNANHVGTITLNGMSATGGLTANCGVTCGDPQITAITASGGNTITIRDNGGHTGTITITGATAIRGLTANCGLCNPQVTAVTAGGVNGIFISDNGGHTDYLKFQ
jgi:hypothetical protein